MGRGGSCCGSEEEENEDEVDYDPANKGNADKMNGEKMDNLLLFQGQMKRDPALMFFVCYCWSSFVWFGLESPSMPSARGTPSN